LDPTEGERYTEIVCRSDEVDNFYKISMQDEDWINPTKDSRQFGEKDWEYLYESEGELEHWKLRLQDASTL